MPSKMLTWEPVIHQLPTAGTPMILLLPIQKPPKARKMEDTGADPCLVASEASHVPF